MLCVDVGVIDTRGNNGHFLPVPPSADNDNIVHWFTDQRRENVLRMDTEYRL